MLNEAYTSQIQLSWGNLLLCYTHAYPELRKSQLRKCSRMINIMWNNVMKRCSQIIRRQSDTPKKKGGCGHEDKHRKDKINIKDVALVNLLYRVNVVLKAGFPFCLKNKTNKQKKKKLKPKCSKLLWSLETKAQQDLFRLLTVNQQKLPPSIL